MASQELEHSNNNNNLYTEDTADVIDGGSHVEDLEGEDENAIEDAELEELRRVRRALGKMNQGIENVQRQIKYFNSNVSQTTQLLDVWVRILSQTAHNHAFLSSDEWQGGGMDSAKLSDLVQRDLERKEEANRRIRDAELQRAREVAEAKERERQRAEFAAATANASGSQRPGETRQPLHARSGRVQDARAQSGGYTRGGAIGRSGSAVVPGARGGRGRGRGSSIPPPTARSRRVQPRR
ncbi:hypothetical protein LPJ81_002226 [Coemansia sp. IMI 209127]|nr:hypothetical protein LPJ81_002226 [Coemansia sp. IMI 209127]